MKTALTVRQARRPTYTPRLPDTCPGCSRHFLRYHIDSMQVPLLDLRRQNEPIESEILAAFQRVLRSGQFILGNEVEQFERAAAALAGARFGIRDVVRDGCHPGGVDGAGHWSREMKSSVPHSPSSPPPAASRAWERGPYSRIPVSAVSTSIPTASRRLITSRSKAIIPVHLFGQAGGSRTDPRYRQEASVSGHRRRRPGFRGGVPRSTGWFIRRFCDRQLFPLEESWRAGRCRAAADQRCGPGRKGPTDCATMGCTRNTSTA